jgi:hypothetical protein
MRNLLIWIEWLTFWGYVILQCVHFVGGVVRGNLSGQLKRSSLTNGQSVPVNTPIMNNDNCLSLKWKYDVLVEYKSGIIFSNFVISRIWQKQIQ